MAFIDGFGEKGRPAEGEAGAVPPNATLEIMLELVSWKTVSDVTKDKKVMKKILKEGEGYERPNDGTIAQCNNIKNSYLKIQFGFAWIFLWITHFAVVITLCQ